MTKQSGQTAHVVCPFCACRIRSSAARAHFLSLDCSERVHNDRATDDGDASERGCCFLKVLAEGTYNVNADAHSQSPRADDACAKAAKGAGRLPSGERYWAAAQSIGADPRGAIRLLCTTRRRSIMLHTDGSSTSPAGSLSLPAPDSLSAPAAKRGYFGSIIKRLGPLGRLFGAGNRQL